MPVDPLNIAFGQQAAPPRVSKMPFLPIFFPPMLFLFSLLCFFFFPLASTAYDLVQTYTSGPVNLSGVATLYHEADVQSNSIKLPVIITDTSALAYESVWIGMGIGEPNSGSMLGANIVTAEFPYMVNDSCIITDRYVPWTAYPLIQAPYPYPLPDDCGIPDWTLVSCLRDPVNGIAILEVTRPLTVAEGNDRQDRSIVPFRNAFLYA